MNKEESLNTLLVLLEKTEQILSIINLSENIVRKYNQLKEMTYDKLGLEFKPLIKKNFENYNSNHSYIPNKVYDITSQNEVGMLWEFIFKTRTINFKKNNVIEFLFDLIENFKFEGNYYMKNLLNETLQKQFDKMENYTFTPPMFKNLEDLDFDLKMEDIKLKEYIDKSEINFKKFVSNLKFSKDKSFLNSNNFSHSEDTIIINNVEDIIKEYERRIDELRRNHDRDIKEYREQFSELKLKYNPQIETELIKLRDDHDNLLFLIEKMNEILIPVYDKYYQKNASWYEDEKIDFKYKELEKINFLISLVSKFFTDNKYLIDLVSSLQREKSIFIEERNLPYVLNAIHNNSLLCEIQDQSKIIENNSENFHKNFEQIIDYIHKNFENI